MPLTLDYQPHQGRVTHHNAYQTCAPLPPLSHWVDSFWQLDVPAGNFCYRSIPDNSVDWIINLNTPQDDFIITPFTSSIVFELTGPVSYFGVRFRILGHQGLIAAPLGEWGAVNHEIRSAELLPSSLLNAVYDAICKPMQFDTRCRYFSGLLLGNVKLPEIDPRLARYIRYCYNNTASNIELTDKQCADFGISARQLRRLSQRHLGLPPREFAQVMRFQRSFQLAATKPHQAAWAEYYYDQPHYIREYKRLTGLTPTELQSLSVLYNPPVD